MKAFIEAVILGAVGAATALFVLWIISTADDADQARCMAAGGDRFISDQDHSCWREDGTRVWYK